MPLALPPIAVLIVFLAAGCGGQRAAPAKLKKETVTLSTEFKVPRPPGGGAVQLRPVHGATGETGYIEGEVRQ